MSLINSILKVFVGDKSQKDVKQIQPLINKVKTFENALAALSNDELRANIRKLDSNTNKTSFRRKTDVFSWFAQPAHSALQ